MATFYEAWEQVIKSSTTNNYDDNFDYYRFRWSLAKRCRESLRGYFPVLEEKRFKRKIASLQPFIERFSRLYDRLADDASRDLLVQILAYGVFGHRKVKLPLSAPGYLKGIEGMRQYTDPADFLSSSFNDWKLYRMRLDPLGFPINLYNTLQGSYTVFVVRQYEHQSGDMAIGVRSGDVVIDAGGCWGDTTLLFATRCGPEGKVYTCEFLPSNLAILRKNLALNVSLAGRVTVIDHPLWSESGKSVWYTDNGPASSISFEELGAANGRAETVTIDDLVRERGLSRVDFIKMDIEGAEPAVLRGAEITLRKFRPRLAVAIYHSLDDFVAIPEAIDSLDLGYRFYLGHYSIHAEESILYAVPKA